MAGNDLFVKTLLGKSVIDSEANSVGKIRDITFNSENWKISELHIKVDGDVKKAMELGGFGSKILKVPPKYVKRLGDVVNLNLPTKEIFEHCDVD